MKRFSILYPLDRCAVCGSQQGIHIHEVYYGTANRRKSIQNGFCVGLCARHHNMSNEGVHFNKALDLRLKQDYETAFLQEHTLEEFMRIIGRNYLDDINRVPMPKGDLERKG